MSNYPKQGQVYTVREIQSLTLKDSPFLQVPAPESMGGGIVVIQTNDGTDDWVAVAEHLEFRYVYTTEEWIPIFSYAGKLEDLAGAVDFELHLSDRDSDPVIAYATIKGHYIDQDYTWVGDRLTAPWMADDETVAAPQHLIVARDKIAGTYVEPVVEEVAVVTEEPAPAPLRMVLNFSKLPVFARPGEAPPLAVTGSTGEYMTKLLAMDEWASEADVAEHVAEMARWAKSVIMDYQVSWAEALILIEPNRRYSVELQQALQQMGLQVEYIA